MSALSRLIKPGSVVPVLAFDSVQQALAISEILVSAGLPLEITLRTPVALECIAAVAAKWPEALVGAGTVMNPQQAQAAREAGARFGVSPGLTDELAEAVRAMDWPFLPGIATVTEAMRAEQHGFSSLKFFPAEASGGAAFLKSIAPVLPALRFCPTGGVGPGNIADYLAVPNVFAVGGSWMIVRGADGGPDLAATREAVTACTVYRQ